MSENELDNVEETESEETGTESGTELDQISNVNQEENELEESLVLNPQIIEDILHRNDSISQNIINSESLEPIISENEVDEIQEDELVDGNVQLTNPNEINTVIYQTTVESVSDNMICPDESSYWMQSLEINTCILGCLFFIVVVVVLNYIYKFFRIFI